MRPTDEISRSPCPQRCRDHHRRLVAARPAHFRSVSRARRRRHPRLRQRTRPSRPLLPDAAADAHHAGPVHLRPQRDLLWPDGVARPRLQRGRFLVGAARCAAGQHRELDTQRAGCGENRKGLVFRPEEFMRNGIVAAVLAVAMATVVFAQRGGEGAGSAGAPPANAPQGGRGAYQPTLWWGDEMFPKWPYPAGDAPYADLDGMKIKGYINEITAISRKSRDDGNQYWGRITGSPYDRMTADWVAAQFKRIGLETRVQEFTDLPEQWWPTSWEVGVGGGGKNVSLKTAFPLYRSVGTNGQAELDPVWVGMGTA